MPADVRTLITGSGGQVGLDLVRRLRSQGDTVFASDLRIPTESEDVGGTWHTLDVTDADAVETLVGDLKPDRIFHLAAILSAKGEAIPDVTYRVNLEGLHTMLECCRKLEVPQLMFTSTIAVFGPGLPELVPDDVPLQPQTMYGVTKAAGEMLGSYYAQRWGLDFRAVRYPGLISASLPGGGSSDYALFMYLDGIRKGSYEAFCRPDTRIPLMYMPDGIRALLELSNASRERLKRCVYNIAAFSPRADEIAASVTQALPNADFTFKPDPVRQGILDSWPAALDDSNARADWDWAPEYDLASMTEHLIPAFRTWLETHGGALADHD